MKILVRNIRIPFDRDEGHAIERACKRIAPLGAHIEGAEIFRRSLDARKKSAILYVYTVCVSVSGSYPAQALARFDAVPFAEDDINIIYGAERQRGRPVIVGFGPCGMFCALLLAENGYNPIVIERGGNIAERKKCVERFNSDGTLDPDCNIQFGAGGAGTFSDGKLMTRINDPLCHYILRRFCDFGAPSRVLIEARPHIGTDLLPNIVDRLAARITELGGEVRFRTSLISVKCDPTGAVCEAVTDKGAIECSSLVLAIGHSARDTYAALRAAGITMECKPFSVGVRIEHLQADIDRALYGGFAGDPALPAGEYSLSAKFDGRGVYSFCMCPGGIVAAAASEHGGVVTNGMSEYARDGKNANCALAVSVFPSDFDGTVDGAVEYVRKIERAAFEHGGGDYCAPVQTVGDFLSGRVISEPGRVMPTYRGGKVRIADLGAVLPPYVGAPLKKGIEYFGRQLEGFDAPDAVMTGAETRTSAPVRMPRSQDGLAIGFPNLYPCGEGAGYAGGITSAAVDGAKCALKIMERYAR